MIIKDIDKYIIDNNIKYKSNSFLKIRIPLTRDMAPFKMLNELTEKVRATLNKERRGKTTAYAHAGILLNQIDYFSNEEAKAKYCGSYKLAPMLSVEELDQLASSI